MKTLVSLALFNTILRVGTVAYFVDHLASNQSLSTTLVVMMTLIKSACLVSRHSYAL